MCQHSLCSFPSHLLSHTLIDSNKQQKAKIISRTVVGVTATVSSIHLFAKHLQGKDNVPTKAVESYEQWDPYTDNQLLTGISTLKFPNNLSIRNYTLILPASEFLSSYAQHRCIPVPYQGMKSISSHPGSCFHKSHWALTKKIEYFRQSHMNFEHMQTKMDHFEINNQKVPSFAIYETAKWNSWNQELPRDFTL